MAQAINIPSPSVFLRKSPPPAEPAAEEKEKPPDRKNAPPTKRQNSAPEGKKKAARKPATNGGIGGGGGDGVVKPKQSKSRNGQSIPCTYRLLVDFKKLHYACRKEIAMEVLTSNSAIGCATCKAKRLKCGEEKPGCQQCARRGVVCGGYKKDFKWRPFGEEQNGKVAVNGGSSKINNGAKQKRGMHCLLCQYFEDTSVSTGTDKHSNLGRRPDIHHAVSRLFETDNATFRQNSANVWHRGTLKKRRAP